MGNSVEGRFPFLDTASPSSPRAARPTRLRGLTRSTCCAGPSNSCPRRLRPQERPYVRCRPRLRRQNALNTYRSAGSEPLPGRAPAPRRCKRSCEDKATPRPRQRDRRSRSWLARWCLQSARRRPAPAGHVPDKWSSTAGSVAGPARRPLRRPPRPHGAVPPGRGLEREAIVAQLPTHVHQPPGSLVATCAGAAEQWKGHSRRSPYTRPLRRLCRRDLRDSARGEGICRCRAVIKEDKLLYVLDDCEAAMVVTEGSLTRTALAAAASAASVKAVVADSPPEGVEEALVFGES